MENKSISELPDHDRYNYLIHHIAKFKEIWLLKAHDGMYAMFEDEKGNSYIPVWPHQELADEYAIEDWEGYVSERMELGEIMEWMDELQEDQILIGAFPNAQMQALSVSAADFKKQILDARKSLG
ncbi:MAG TPA: DUF2750 domain-containing protein [Bacteroidales bacterium]|nr:DUF2750 domain-containing protein [Bacteroidales bacterium]